MNTVELKDYVLVKVPEISTGFDLDYNSSAVICFGEYVDAGYIPLPKGNYQIIGLAKDLDTSQWVEIIGHFQYPDEFLKHHKLEESNTLILKKIL